MNNISIESNFISFPTNANESTKKEKEIDVKIQKVKEKTKIKEENSTQRSFQASKLNTPKKFLETDGELDVLEMEILDHHVLKDFHLIYEELKEANRQLGIDQIIVQENLSLKELNQAKEYILLWKEKLGDEEELIKKAFDQMNLLYITDNKFLEESLKSKNMIFSKALKNKLHVTGDIILPILLMCKENPTEEEKKFIEFFLLHIKDNHKIFSKIFNELNESNLKKDLKGLSISEKNFHLVIESLSELCEIYSNQEQFKAVYKKLVNLIQKLDKKEQISENEKFTFLEYGYLFDLEAQIDKIDILVSGLQSLKDHPNLKSMISEIENLYKDLANVSELVNQLNDIYQIEIDRTNHYRSGDTGAYISKRLIPLQNQEKSYETILKSLFITSLGHITKIYRENPNENHISQTRHSHVTSIYKNQEFQIHQAALSKVFRLHVWPLVNPNSEVLKILKIKFNNDEDKLSAYLQDKYYEIQKRLHQRGQDEFKKFVNDAKRRQSAGLADFNLAGSHKKESPRKDKFMNIHKQFLEEQPNENKLKIICSEFGVKSDIAALIELDREISKEIAEESGIDLKTDELNLLFLPYDESERLKRIHPGRMIQLMQEKKCLEEVPHPEIVKLVFKQKELNL